MKTILLDLDGVLVDFVRGSLAFHKKDFSYRDLTWDFPKQVGFGGTWAAEFWDPLGHDFWANLPWHPSGKELLGKIVEAYGEENVVICTSPCMTPGGTEGKLEWIRREIPSFARRFLVTPGKHWCAGADRVLVDDHDANCDKFREAGGRAVTVPQPWNRFAHWLEGEDYLPSDVMMSLRTIQ